MGDVMVTTLVFKIKNIPGFERDPLIKNVNKRLKTNYNFKHVIKGDYILTPDLTQLIKEPEKITSSKNLSLLMYLLTLYKYAVMKGYLDLVNITTPSTDPAFNESLKSLVKYVLNKEEKQKIFTQHGVLKAFKYKTSVVLEQYKPIKEKLLYKKFIVLVNPEKFPKRNFDTNKLPEYLLKTYLSKVRSLFEVHKTPKYYTIKDNKVVKVFEYLLLENFDKTLITPPVLPLLEHYIKTGKTIIVNGYTPLEQLIRNFNSVVLGTKAINLKDLQTGTPPSLKTSRYYTVTVSKGNSLFLDEDKIREYYDLFRNIVTLHSNFVRDLYELGFRTVEQYFNPPANIIKQLIEQVIQSDFGKFNITSPPKIELIWKSLKTNKGEYPYFIALRVSVIVRKITGDSEKFNYYYVVYNNIEQKTKEQTRFFKIESPYKVKMKVIAHTITIHFKRKEYIKAKITIV